MMSEIRLTLGVATPISSSARHSAGRSRWATCGSARFCSADAELAGAVSIREIGDGIHLPRRSVSRRLPFPLERERHDRVARKLMVGDRVVQPDTEALVFRAHLDLTSVGKLYNGIAGLALLRRGPGFSRGRCNERSGDDERETHHLCT